MSRRSALNAVLASGLVALSVSGCSGMADLVLPSGPTPVTLTSTSDSSQASSGPASVATSASGVGAASAAGSSPTAVASYASGSAAGASSRATAPSASGAGSGTSTPSPSVSVPTVVIARPPAPQRLPVAKGYTYVKAPAEVVAAFNLQRARQALSIPLVRSVKRGEETIGSVAGRRLHPSQVGDAEIEKSLLDGVLEGLKGRGYTLTTRRVSGVDVVVAVRKDSTIAAWYHRGVLLQFVSSEPESVALRYAKATLAR